MENIKKLAAESFRFFPCYKSKAPAVSQGFYDSTNNIEKLELLFNNDDYLIGFPCGEMNKNIIVLDIDINSDGDIRTVDEILDDLENYGAIDRNGFQVESMSGGRHLYFQAPEGVKITGGSRSFHKSLPIDMRATGQYVIFPDNKNYFVYDSEIEIEDFHNNLPALPEWIINFKKQQEEVQEQSLAVDPLPPEEIREIKSALAYMPSDDRDSWINIGMALKNTGSRAAYGLWNEFSQKSEKYNPADMEYRWKTFKPNDITIASIFFEAAKYGWVTTYQKVPVQSIDNITMPDEKKIREIKEQFKKKIFPEELLRPDGLVGEIVEYVLEKSIVPQPIFALSAALCAVGALAGRKVQTQFGTRSNIYCLNVGGSGSGKDGPRKAIKKLFHLAGCGEMASVEGLSSDTAIITELSKPGLESQIFLLDEVGQFLNITKTAASYLAAVPAVLLTLYSSSDQVFRGKSYADDTKRATIVNPNLCLLGTTVPDILYKGLSYESATDGFLSRMLIFETDNNRPRKVRNPSLLTKPAQSLLNKVKALHQKPINLHPDGNLDHLQPEPQIVPMNENAFEMLVSFEDYIHNLRNTLEDENRIEAIYNRTSQMAEQIALIVSVGINQDEPVITEKEMAYSISLTKYLSDQMQNVVENYMAKNELEHEVKRILNIIRKSGCTSLAEISKHTQNLGGHTRNDILETLKNSGQIAEHPVGQGVYVSRMFTAI